MQVANDLSSRNQQPDGMDKKRQKPSAPTEIFAGRQPRRPHYLAKIMDRANKQRADLIEDLGVDKGQLSRWLDEDRPTTPSLAWAKRLGRYFAVTDDPDDFVDIFTDPDLTRFQKITRGLPDDEVDRMLTSIEAGYSAGRRR